MILIIGYGNPLRGDDAIGQHIAQIIAQRMKHEASEVITTYQLTPELVEPISRAQKVFFIDARVGETPGRLICENIESEAGAGAFTHNVNPGALLGATRELYGVAPDGVLISIVGMTFDYGGELSSELNRKLPMLIDEVETIINAIIRVHR